MKKHFAILLLVSILFQSCYSYKKINYPNDALISGEKYKIVYDGKVTRPRVLTESDSTIKVLRYGEERILQKSKVESIKIRKFSLVKTIALPLGIIAAIVGLYATSDINVPLEFNSPN